MRLTPEQIALIQLILTVIVGILGWAIKTTLQSINQRLDTTESTVEAHNSRLGNIDREIAVMTERQGHVQMLIAEKLDRIHDKIDNQNKMIAVLVNRIPSITHQSSD
jgi:uncharacterized protein YoxC